MAIDAALKAHAIWSETDWRVRANILLRAADLIAGKYRALINASCMLGQSKNIYQAVQTFRRFCVGSNSI